MHVFLKQPGYQSTLSILYSLPHSLLSTTCLLFVAVYQSCRPPVCPFRHSLGCKLLSNCLDVDVIELFKAAALSSAGIPVQMCKSRDEHEEFTSESFYCASTTTHHTGTVRSECAQPLSVSGGSSQIFTDNNYRLQSQSYSYRFFAKLIYIQQVSE